MRWSRFGLGALVGILALAGCGTPGKDEYLLEANAICALGHKKLEEIPEPSSPEEVAAITEQEITVREEVLVQLEELVTPHEIAGGVEGVIKALETRQERARAMKKAAEDKDKAALREEEEKERMEFEREAHHAEAVGMDECADI